MVCDDQVKIKLHIHNEFIKWFHQFCNYNFFSIKMNVNIIGPFEINSTRLVTDKQTWFLEKIVDS